MFAINAVGSRTVLAATVTTSSRVAGCTAPGSMGSAAAKIRLKLAGDCHLLRGRETVSIEGRHVFSDDWAGSSNLGKLVVCAVCWAGQN